MHILGLEVLFLLIFVHDRFFANSWPCLNFGFYPVLIACCNRHWQKVATMFEKAESANSPPFARNRCLFIWGAYFCMGTYKHDVVVVIKMGAYINGVLILCGCLFYGI